MENCEYLSKCLKDAAEKYVAEHLDTCEYGLRDFVISALNPTTRLGIHLMACPGCAFLHMAGTQCDICAALPTASGAPVLFLRSAADGEGFRHALAQARERRARTLYDCWMSGHLGADALYLAALTAEEPMTISASSPRWAVEVRVDKRYGELARA